MRFQDWMSGQWAVRIGLWIGQRWPQSAGYGLARLIADTICRWKPEVYRTVRANLRQVLGPETGDAVVDQMTHRVFCHAGRTYYEFFRIVGQPRHVLARAVRISPSLVQLIQSETAAGRGVLLLGIHMSNFDLGLMAVAANDLPAQVLSLAGPHDGFEMLNDLRAVEGFEVTPVTPHTLRMAIRRLRSGGLVITGADRPVHDDRGLVEFFGRPAYLPLGPARLALMTGAMVLLGACHHSSDEGYVLDVIGPIAMPSTGDRTTDVLAGTRRIAIAMEQHVRAHPDQWLMFHPVWPEPSEGE